MKKRVTAMGAGILLSTALITGGSPPVQAAGRTVSTVPAMRVNRQVAIATALKYLGTAYIHDGVQPDTGFDDIGFVTWVYGQQGVNLPHDRQNLLSVARDIKAVGLQPGHLIFFKNTIYSGLSHVAIYLGGGKFIHAEWYGRGVVISSFTNDPVDGNYWLGKYLGKPRPVEMPSGVSSPAPAVGASGIVLTVALNLHSRPSFSSPVVRVLSGGTHVKVIASQGLWDELTAADGATGWALAAFIGPATIL